MCCDWVFTAVIVGLSISFIMGQEGVREDQPLDGYSWLHFAVVVAAVVLCISWVDGRTVDWSWKSSGAPAWTSNPSSSGRSRTQIRGWH